MKTICIETASRPLDLIKKAIDDDLIFEMHGEVITIDYIKDRTSMQFTLPGELFFEWLEKNDWKLNEVDNTITGQEYWESRDYLSRDERTHLLKEFCLQDRVSHQWNPVNP